MKKLLLTLVTVSLASAGYAQTPATPAATTTPGAAAATPAPPAKPLSITDKKLLKDLSEAILIEQMYLKLLIDTKPMLSESVDRDVKKSDGDLKRLWTALATLATSKKADLTAEVSKSDLAKVQKLGKEKPDRFQKEFFKDFGRETGKAAKLVENTKTVQDPEVKIFIEDWASVIKGVDRLSEAGAKGATGKK